MRFFLKFFLILTLSLFLTSAFLINANHLTYPFPSGPITDSELRLVHLKFIEEEKPQVVLLGDSTLKLGVDSNLFEKQINKPIYNISIPGSASALWYLILKNNIVESSYKPPYLLIVFRDTILTAPAFRVHGNYFTQIAEFARQNEPLLIENSFTNYMSPLEIAAERYLPLYSMRAKIREDIDNHIHHLIPSLLGCDPICVQTSLDNLFTFAEINPILPGDEIRAAESYLYTSEQLDFDTQLNRSYLPEMIRLAKENNISIVFVRIKVKTDTEHQLALGQYIEKLSSYFADNEIYFLDFGDDTRLTSNLFQDAIHLNESGRELFTQLLAEEMNKIISEK
ncbi:MAG TPA: hypothetical protein DHW49_02250 [Anaerolineae bacterium]|nr:hypothetical protein [Anaerolineae bacterium]